MVIKNNEDEFKRKRINRIQEPLLHKNFNAMQIQIFFLFTSYEVLFQILMKLKFFIQIQKSMGIRGFYF